MIGRLSTIITAAKDTVYRRTALRFLCYLAIALALLAYWLYFGDREVSFVYNAF